MTKDILRAGIEKALKEIPNNHRGERKELLLPMQQVELDELVDYLIVGLQKGLLGLPLVSCCGNIGRYVVEYLEIEDQDFKTENIRKFLMGYELLYVAVELEMIEFIRRDFPKAPYIIVPFSHRENLDNLSKEDIKEVIDARRDETMILLEDLIGDESESIRSFNGPFTTEPNPYDSLEGDSGDLIHRATEIVKTQVEVECALGTPKYLLPVNKMQSVAKRINEDALEIIEECKDDYIYNQKHKRMSVKARKSVSDSYDRALNDAKELIGGDIFEEYHYDYRGRIYSRSTNLNYGSHKLAKALFYFANDKPLGPNGWNDLLIHTTNCWGEDKLLLNDRIAFAEDNLDKWMKWAEEPLKYKGRITRRGKKVKEGWQTADSPWEFLAAIREIKAAIDSGDEYTYSSGLPAAIDCSISGLQFWTILTRCNISAPMCNLIPEDIRGDLYLAIGDGIFSEIEYSDEDQKALQEIVEQVEEATKSKRKLKEYCGANAKTLSKLAKQFWDQYFEKRRSLCKRSSMTKLYTCGTATMAEHIFEDHKTDKEIVGLNSIFAFCLAVKINNMCKKLLPGPISGMDVVMEVARRDHKKGNDFFSRGIITNFPFMQEYRVDVTQVFEVKYKDKEIGLRILVDRVRENLQEKARLIDKMKEKLENAENDNHKKNIKRVYKKLISKTSSERDAACGGPPNYIHGMGDAQWLALVILSAQFDVMTVHDSVACVPADMENLYRITRESFEPFMEADMLKKLLEDRGYMDLYDKIKYGTMEKVECNQFAVA